MTPHHPSDRMLASRTRQRVAAKRPEPRRTPLRLMPWIAIGAVLMLAAPATAQLSGVGQVTSTVQGSVELPPLPEPQISTRLDLQKSVNVSAPQVDLEGHVYTVLSTAQMATAQARGATYLCGQISSQAPAGLSSYADVCSHLDAQALFVNAQGLVQAVQLAGQWISMPDLHQEVSIDIQADASAGTSFLGEARGWLESKAQATGQGMSSGATATADVLVSSAQSAGSAIASGAQSIRSSISANVDASIDFFGGF